MITPPFSCVSPFSSVFPPVLYVPSETIVSHHPDEKKHGYVPRLQDGDQLQTWGIAHGLLTAPTGMSTTEYYQLLCNRVERRHHAKAAKASKSI